MVLEVIRSAVERRGYPPSMREIGDAVGLTSPSSVAHQLATLERKGYIRRDPNRPRAIEVRSPEPDGAAYDPTGEGDERPAPTYVPVVGRIAAGGPILAEQAVEDVFPLPRQIVGDGELFLLKVVGDSMVDAAICDGDWVVVRTAARRGQRGDRGGDDRRTRRPSRRTRSATGTSGSCRTTRRTHRSPATRPRSSVA